MLDKTKLIQVAQELGLEIEFDSEKPGVFLEESLNVMTFSDFKLDFLGNTLIDEQVDKDSYATQIFTSHYLEQGTKKHFFAKRATNYFYNNINTKKSVKKKYDTKSKNERTYSKSSKNNQYALAA